MSGFRTQSPGYNSDIRTSSLHLYPHYFRITIREQTKFKVVSPGFEPRSAGPEPTMMDRYTKRLADGPKASHSSSKRCLINHVIVQLHHQV